MKILILSLLIILNSFAEENPNDMDINNSFITKYEYGKMLYNNPRGIGCNNCHGDDARGKKLVEFKHVQNQEEYFCSLIAPDIKYIEYDVFSKKVNLKKNDNLKFEKDQVCDKLIYKANSNPMKTNILNNPAYPNSTTFIAHGNIKIISTSNNINNNAIK